MDRTQCLAASTGSVHCGVNQLGHGDRRFVCLLTDLLNQLATADSNSTAEDGSETAERSSAPGSPASSRRGSRSADCQEIQPKYSQEQLEAVRK